MTRSSASAAGANFEGEGENFTPIIVIASPRNEGAAIQLDWLKWGSGDPPRAGHRPALRFPANELIGCHHEPDRRAW